MKPIKTHTVSPDMEKKVAKWERNVAMLYLAVKLNEIDPENDCGYYIDNKYKNGKRMISLYGGLMTFRIPDSFDVGRLPEVEVNWDGHTTEEKYTEMMRFCGCVID